MFWAFALLLSAAALLAIGAAIWFYTRFAAETAILRAENLRLVAAEAELRARLDAERLSSDQMRQQFQSLSSEALERNNRQFLDLARSELSRHQSEAQGDLTRRQQAIDEVVKPLR